MSFNPQLLATLSQMGVNNNALASALLASSRPNPQNANGAPQAQQPPLVATAPAASVPAASTSHISRAQVQALLVGASLPQPAAPPKASANNSVSQDQLSSLSQDKALTDLILRQKLTESGRNVGNSASGVPPQGAEVKPAARVAEASPLQQLLGKVLQMNDANLNPAPANPERRVSSNAAGDQSHLAAAVATSLQQPQDIPGGGAAAAPSSSLIEQLRQLSNSRCLPPASSAQPQAQQATSTPCTDDSTSLLVGLLQAAERQRQEKEQEERRKAANQNILAQLLQQQLQQQQPERNGVDLLGLLRSVAEEPAPSTQSHETMAANVLSSLLPQQQQVPAPAPSMHALMPQAQQAPPASNAQVLAPVMATSAPVAPASSVPNMVAVPEKKRRRGRSGSFPQKIHQMLRDLEQQGRQDIASFVRNGTAFCIHRPKEFSKEVMPKYFKMGSYASFQRQLNLYDFTRIAEGKHRGSYFHALFLQGKPLLSTTMKRKESKKATLGC